MPPSKVKKAKNPSDKKAGVEPLPKEKIMSNQGNEYDYTPFKNHKHGKPGENPIKSEPNSSMDIYDKNGNHVQRRWYDKNGDVYRDLDLTNHGNSKKHPEYPHEHLWKDGVRGK
ncbi:hypothetical protein SAMN02745116_01427 [Pilibacter termitis]|uniref:Uncharacterized protein n=1 Tax=Pilibacter termitis TaxID=263852 RepID=A0A1T4NIA7_9ENTE|nr:hypothetical protein SAMN02745116_01427 [Pilibacter termitis]